MVHIRIEELEEYAKENNIPIMQKEGIEFLCNYIKKNKVENILEIGTAIGYSAIKMASVSDNIQVTTIEKDEERYEEAIKNIKLFELDKRIKVLNSDALEVCLKDTYDLIFIDAAKGQYIKFFERFDKNLRVGGTVVSDNLMFHGLVEDDSKTKNRNTRQLVRKIKKYIEFLTNNSHYKTKFYRKGDGISISIKEDSN